MADYTVFRDRFRDKLVFKTPVKAITIGAAETTGNFTILGNALVHTITVQIPDWTNTVTLTLTIADVDSVNIYTSSALAQNTNHIITDLKDSIPIWGVNTFTATLSGVPGGTGGDVSISIYFI